MSAASLQPQSRDEQPDRSDDLAEQMRVFNLNQVREMELQQQEFEIRRDENLIERAKIESSRQYTSDSLRYQSDFWTRHQANSQERFKWRLMFLLLFLVLLLGFTYLLITLHQAKLAEEILKSVALLLAGGAGGYGIGVQRRDKKDRQEQPEES